MLKTILSLSFVVASRFFGLFIILPVFSLYASSMKGSNAMLAGIAIGIYALMQMLFQVPFGILSDKIGRKNMMSLGLIIFIIGSFICGFTDNIYWMIFGRFLQGSGAVGSVATAMISDFTPEENRGKAMAIMGMMIGASFGLSMVLSPLLSSKYGLGSLFFLSAILTLICIVLLYTAVPKEVEIKSMQKKVPLKEILANKDLNLMNLTNFLQKMLLTMTFFLIPIVLVGELDFSKDKLWIVYTIAMFFGFLAMGMAGFVGEKKGLSKEMLLVGVGFFGLAYVSFALFGSVWLFIVGVMLFFIGFNMHEPIMQSVASKLAKSDQKGAVLGVFNAAGYFGSFLGGLFGGMMMDKLGVHHLAMMIVVVCLVWLFLLFGLSNPARFKNIYLENPNLSLEKLKNLESKKGFIESYKKNQTLVIKFDKELISESEIRENLGV